MDFRLIIMESIIYNQKGAEAGKIKLPESVFGLPWNADLVHQVVTSMVTSARKPYAHTKTRGEVSGGGKKPWKQKGTGRARHGSTRSPIWVGGGIAHGPRHNEQNFDRKINKKMKTKALYTILSQKARDGEILFIENIALEAPKTKFAKGVLDTVSSIKGFEKMTSKKQNAAFLAIAKKDTALERSFRNISSILVDEVRNMNPLTLLNYKYLVVTSPEESIKVLEKRLAYRV